MSVQDTLWLNMDRPDNLMTIDCVFWTSAPVTLAQARQTLQERMVDRFPTFRSRPVPAPVLGARAAWEPDPAFDLDRHILAVTLPEPGRAGLERFLSEQRGMPLPGDRPLWLAHVVHELDGGSAVVIRLHHAIADGIRLTQVALGLFDGQERAAATTPRTASPAPGASLLGGLRSLTGAVLDRVPVAGPLARPFADAAGGLAEQALVQADRARHTLAAVTPLLSLPAEVPAAWRGPLGERKSVVWGDPVPLERVKEVGRRTGGTVNDVLTTWLAGALARYLSARGEQPVTTTWLMPVNLKPFDHNLPETLGNHFAVVPLELPSGREPLTERIALLQRRTGTLRDSHTAALMYAVQQVGSQTPRPVARFLTDLVANQSVGVLTNVPGPRDQVTFAGVPVAGMVAWAPSTSHQPISVSIFSYAGSVVVGFACDERVIPDAPALLQAFEDEVAASLR